MGKIVVLGSLLSPSTFQQWMDAGERLDPIYQAYGMRLLSLLKTDHTIQVISLGQRRTTTKRLWFKEMIQRSQGMVFIQFPYLAMGVIHRWMMIRQCRRYLKKLSKIEQDSVDVFVDMTSALAGKICTKLSRISNLRFIGFHSPTQRSQHRLQNDSQWLYSMHRSHRHHHGYILHDFHLRFRPQLSQQPRFYVPWVAQPIAAAKQHKKPYLFYAGPLDVDTGVESLLQGWIAFNMTTMDLLIAGEGPLATMIEKMSQTYRHIKYLGQLTLDHVMRYQAGAYANLFVTPTNPVNQGNPFLFMEAIHQAAPVLTTRQPWIDDTLSPFVSWIEESSEDGIRVALQRFFQSDDGLNLTKAQRAKTLLLNTYQPSAQAQSLLTWLAELK